MSDALHFLIPSGWRWNLATRVALNERRFVDDVLSSLFGLTVIESSHAPGLSP
jgi:hypothetical protein